MTSLEIEPSTFWFVAYCLNELHYHVPQFIMLMLQNSDFLFKDFVTIVNT
jgi:hypothetical protein